MGGGNENNNQRKPALGQEKRRVKVTRPAMLMMQSEGRKLNELQQWGKVSLGPSPSTGASGSAQALGAIYLDSTPCSGPLEVKKSFPFLLEKGAFTDTRCGGGEGLYCFFVEEGVKMCVFVF